MGKNSQTYVAIAEKGTGWRIKNRKTKRFWGNFYKNYPQDVLNELNGQKRPEKLTSLAKKSFAK